MEGVQRLSRLMFLCFSKTHSGLSWIKILSTRSLKSTACRCRFYEVPSREEAIRLSQRYPDPAGTVIRFLEPMSRLYPEHGVKVKIDSSRYVKEPYWKISLGFTWPECFSVRAINTDFNTAVNGAFLQACRMLENLGLLTRDGQEVSFVEHLLAAKRKSLSSLRFDLLNIESRCELLEDGSQLWHSKIKLWWPVSLECEGVGLSQEDAVRNASVRVFIKLKAGQFLNKNNNIRDPSRIELPLHKLEMTSKAEYEVFVDSSIYGYGAYLCSNIEDDRSCMIPWINSPWPEGIKDLFMVPNSDSTLFELCGVLSAIYTWKKKFVGKRVLVYNDNMNIVTMINQGLCLTIRGKNSAYTKVYSVLRDTCVRYTIQLKAQHIYRDLNKPADSLSKSRITDFKDMVPNAKHIGKKSKQLLFCMPLVDMDIVRKFKDVRSEHNKKNR